MTTFALDTNVVIAAIKGETKVRKRFDKARGKGNKIVVPSIVLFELEYGIGKSARADAAEADLKDFLKLVSDVIALSDTDAACAGRLRAALDLAGTPIGPYDILIAGQALNRGLTLVTRNVREFERVKGLSLANWHAPATP